MTGASMAKPRRFSGANCALQGTPGCVGDSVSTTDRPRGHHTTVHPTSGSILLGGEGVLHVVAEAQEDEGEHGGVGAGGTLHSQPDPSVRH